MSTAIPQVSCLQVLRSQRSESQCSQPMGATYPRVLWRVCAIRRHPQSRSPLAALHCVWIVMIRFTAIPRVSCFQVPHSRRSESLRSQLTGATTRLSSPSTLAWRHTRESSGVFATSGVTHSLARRLALPTVRGLNRSDAHLISYNLSERIGTDGGVHTPQHRPAAASSLDGCVSPGSRPGAGFTGNLVQGSGPDHDGCEQPALVQTVGADPAQLLGDLSPITALERTQGHWG